MTNYGLFAGKGMQLYPDDQTFREIKLRDGRMLAYAECGVPDGKPVIYFHGAPSTRYSHPDSAVTERMGVRLITIDRPGFGDSDFQPDRKVLDWPDDVTELADRLSLSRFAVVGTSAGGPYVAACAWKIPERLTNAAMVGSLSPLDDSGLIQGMPRQRRAAVWIARHQPWLMRPLFRFVGNPAKDVEKFFASYTAHNPPADREIIESPTMRKMLIECYRTSVKQGVRGFAHEIVILHRPWGFRLENIRIPIHLWHGELDNSMPVAMAHAMQRSIPDCRARYFASEAHFVLFKYWEELLRDLIE